MPLNRIHGISGIRQMIDRVNFILRPNTTSRKNAYYDNLSDEIKDFLRNILKGYLQSVGIDAEKWNTVRTSEITEKLAEYPNLEEVLLSVGVGAVRFSITSDFDIGGKNSEEGIQEIYDSLIGIAPNISTEEIRGFIKNHKENSTTRSAATVTHTAVARALGDRR